MPTTSLLQVAGRCGIQTPLSVRDDLVPYAADTAANSLQTVLSYATARSSANPDSAELISISGTATITAVNPSLAGYDHTIQVELQLTNLTGEFLAVDSSALLLTDSGGYVLMANTSLFGGNSILGDVPVPILPEAVLTGSSNLGWGGGPCNVVVNLCVHTAGGARQNLVQRVKILRPGFAAPENIAVPAPVYVGLWNRPVEVIEVWRSTGADRWLTFGGQIVNLTPGTTPVRVRGWSVRILKGGKTLFDLNPPLTFRRVEADGAVAGSAIAPAPDGSVTLLDLRSAFVFGFSVIGMPNVVSDVTLEVILDYMQASPNGKEISVVTSCAYNLINRNATLLPAAPVKALASRNWFWGNGPDHTGFDAHAWSGERYCYDLTMRDSNNSTFSGDCQPPAQPGGPSTGACAQNTSFYDYGQPFFAAVAGTVALENHTAPENFGYNPNPLTGAGNYVVSQQADGSIAGYFHIHPEPSGPAVQSQVAVGAALGHVGNSGSSSEPHLHFGYVTLDHTGRGIITPVAFANLKTPGGVSVNIMPGTAAFKS